MKKKGRLKNVMKHLVTVWKKHLENLRNGFLNIGRIFTGDLKMIRHNTIAWIVILGLTVVPSFYAWFNIAASWDPYGNTGNLKVAVANMDEGYTGDLFPITLNVGDQVEMSLHANNQLNWVFTGEKEAIRGVKDGSYYAAIVLPKSFSRDIMSLFSEEKIQRSDILYYLNEKENAIAPKITDKGASAVQKQIDQVFAQTVTEIGLEVVDGVSQMIDGEEAEKTITSFSGHLNELSDELDDSADLIETFASIVSSLKKVTESSNGMLDAAEEQAGKSQSMIEEASESIGSLSEAVTGTTEAVNQALDETKASYFTLSSEVDYAMEQLLADTDKGKQQLTKLAGKVQENTQAMESFKKSLETLRDSLPDTVSGVKDSLNQVIRMVQTNIDNQYEIRNDILNLVDSIGSTQTEIDQKHDNLKNRIEKNYRQIESLQKEYEVNVETKILTMIDTLGETSKTIVSLLDQMDASVADINDVTVSLTDNLGSLQRTLSDTAKTMHRSGKKLDTLAAKLLDAAKNNQLDELQDILDTGPQEISEFVAAPVKLDTNKFYPVENYGSAMAPFYSTLAIWVGGVVLVAMMRVNVDRKRQEALVNVTPTQLYLGRYILFLIIGLLQSGLICLGDLYFLEIQCEHPFYFMIAGWFTSIVYVNLLYTLTVSFGDIGKAICVVLMVIQVAGSGGTFPIEMTPMFFQKLYELLPFTHSMMAMRECIAGFYGNTYWQELGILSLYLIASLLLGLVLRKPIIRLNEAFNEKLEETKVI